MPHEPYLSYSADPAVAVGHATHAGQSGKNNEDLYALFQTRYEGDDGFGARHALVLAVADGIGGSVAGELASDLAIQAVAAAFRESRRPIPQRLDAAIRRANADIYHQSSENAALAGMGTTIVAAIVGADQVQIGHVGDSRAYLLRNGALYLLTQDHSWAQEAVDAGRLTPEAARVHPNRHVIKRYLGGAPEVEIDYRLLPPPQSAPQGAPKAAPAPAHIAASLGNGQTATQPMAPRTPTRSLSNESLDFLPGDTLLLCSDGLSDVVAHDAIRDILKRHDPQSAADKLVAEANRAGGPDNITVIVARRAGGALPMAARRRPPVWVGALLLALLAGAGGGTAFLLAGRNDATGDGAQAALAMAATATDAPAAGLVTETPTETPAEPTQTPTPTPLPEATTDASALAPPVAPPVEPMTASAAVSGTDGVTDSTALQAEPTATDTPAPIPPTPTLPPNTTATPTPRAKSTLAVTKTPTPSATPSPTPTPSATPPSTNTPTVTPTSPPSTPTNTPAAPALLWTLTPSVTPTGAPQGAAPGSPAAAPTLAPAPSGGPTAINANRPPPGETYDAGVSVSFEYKLVGELAAGQSLRLVIWQAGETPGSRWYPASPSTATAPPLNQGTYWWGVQVVDEGSATVVRLLPSDRTFVVQPPARDEGGNDEDDDGGDDDEDDDGGDPGGGPPPP